MKRRNEGQYREGVGDGNGLGGTPQFVDMDVGRRMR